MRIASVRIVCARIARVRIACVGLSCMYPVCIYSCPVNLDVDCRLESRQAHVLDLDHFGLDLFMKSQPQ